MDRVRTDRVRVEVADSLKPAVVLLARNGCFSRKSPRLCHSEIHAASQKFLESVATIDFEHVDASPKRYVFIAGPVPTTRYANNSCGASGCQKFSTIHGYTSTDDNYTLLID